jgi:hypothetical protein
MDFCNKEILVSGSSMQGKNFNFSRMSALAFGEEDEEDDDMSPYLNVVQTNGNSEPGELSNDDDESLIDESMPASDYIVTFEEDVAVDAEIASWRPTRFPVLYDVICPCIFFFRIFHVFYFKSMFFFFCYM